MKYQRIDKKGNFLLNDLDNHNRGIPLSFDSRLSKDDIYSSFDYEYTFIMSPNKKNVESSFVLQQLRKKKLQFPLSRYYLSEDDINRMLTNFYNYEPTWLNRTFTELKSQKGTMWLPTKFRGISRQLVTNKSDWWNVDLIVDYFTEYERINAKKEYSSPVSEDWQDDQKVLNAIMACENKVNCMNLRHAIFHETARELSLFRISRTKSFLQAILFNDFEGKSLKEFQGKRWLDMSAGWGDRLFTACALGMDYVGFDPNTNLKYGHSEIIEKYGNGNQKVYYKPYEKNEKIVKQEIMENGLFDIALCSPPFWIIERYNGKEQSTENYKQFNDWLVEFLFNSLYITWANLKIGGYLAINLGNIRNCDMVGPMQLFIEEYLENSSWEGIITFSGRGTQDIPGALYCWKKNDLFETTSTHSSGEYTLSDDGDISLDSIFSPRTNSNMESFNPDGQTSPKSNSKFSFQNYNILADDNKKNINKRNVSDINTLDLTDGEFENSNFKTTGYNSPRYNFLSRSSSESSEETLCKSPSIPINKDKHLYKTKCYKDFNSNNSDRWAAYGKSRNKSKSPEKYYRWKKSPDNNSNFSPREHNRNLWNPEVQRSLTDNFPKLAKLWKNKINM